METKLKLEQVTPTPASASSANLTGTPTAPTPSTDDNSTKIATTAYVKSNLDNYVDLNSTQTITGNKTFNNAFTIRSNEKIAGSLVVISNPDITKGIEPSQNQQTIIGFYGSTLTDWKDKIGMLGCLYNEDKSSSTVIKAYNSITANSTAECAISVNIDTDGNPFTYAPTPATSDNSTQIATTAFVKAQNYITASSDITGNAATATEFSEAKSVTLTGAITGTASSKASWSIATARRSCSVGQSGSSSTNPWYKVATVDLSPTANYDASIDFLVEDTYSSHKYGILKAHIRTNGSKIVDTSSSELTWLTHTGFTLNDFVLVCPTTAGPTCELWTKIATGYMYRKFTVLSEGYRANFSNSLWTLLNASSAGQASSITTEGTQIVSTNACNANTATKLGTSTVGSTTTPIYLDSGTPTALSYTIAKSVPSNAVFTDTVYTHPTTSGNKHIPSGGSSGQFLKWSADGTATWANDNNTDTKVNVTLGTTTKAYVLGTSTTPTSTATGVTAIADTGVYLDTTAGKLTATTFAGNLSGNATGVKTNTISAGNYVDAIQSYDADATSNRCATVRLTNGDGYHAILLGVHNESNGAPSGLEVKSTNGTITASLGGNFTATKFIGALQGNANTATKLGTANKGSAGTPIYLASGAPTECTINNITATGDLGWSSATGNGRNLANTNTLAYWNGRYNSSSSNLAYCNKGAFGDMATKTASNYVATSGNQSISGVKTFSGTLVLTNTTDADTTSYSAPALVIGGTTTGSHMEIDGNEIIAKGSDTTTATLYLNGGGQSISLDSTQLFPYVTKVLALGKSNRLWTTVYAQTSTINTSDIREKQAIDNIPDEVLDAWGEVNFKQYKLNDSVSKKGFENARLHTGLIAQEIMEIFEKHGLDPTKYGLFCHDEWDEHENPKDENSPVIAHKDAYALRYEEALCMEAAYQRRRLDRIEALLSKLS